MTHTDALLVLAAGWVALLLPALLTLAVECLTRRFRRAAWDVHCDDALAVADTRDDFELWDAEVRR